MISSFAGAGEMRARTSGHSIRDAAQNASGERKNRAKRGLKRRGARREKSPAEWFNRLRAGGFRGARKRILEKIGIDFDQ